MLVVYYSRTGTTRRVARAVAETVDVEVGPPTVERVRPERPRSYPEWLLLSFLPGSRVAIEPAATDLSDYDAVFLGTPKWTLSCPPVTEYLARAELDVATVGVFLTYGGFDEERYLAGLVDRLEARGADVPATLRVKRDRIDSGKLDDGVASFCEAVLEGS